MYLQITRTTRNDKISKRVISDGKMAELLLQLHLLKQSDEEITVNRVSDPRTFELCKILVERKISTVYKKIIDEDYVVYTEFVKLSEDEIYL